MLYKLYTSDNIPVFTLLITRTNKFLFVVMYELSNVLILEPGYYREGDFGIRLENIMEVVEKPWLKHASGQPFYGFKDVTLVPYEPKLIDLHLLSVYHVS